MTTPANASRNKLIKFFAEADVDKSGFLSSKELKGALKNLGYKFSQSDMKKQFAHFDLDGDKRVSCDEFLVCMGELPASVHESAMVRKMFLTYDINHDGHIDRKELGLVFQQMHKKQMTNLEVGALMKLVDTDGNGKIEYEEFVRFFGKKTSA